MKKKTPKVPKLPKKMVAFRFREEDLAHWRKAAALESLSTTEFVRIACQLLANQWLGSSR